MSKADIAAFADKKWILSHLEILNKMYQISTGFQLKRSTSFLPQGDREIVFFILFLKKVKTTCIYITDRHIMYQELFNSILSFDRRVLHRRGSEEASWKRKGNAAWNGRLSCLLVRPSQRGDRRFALEQHRPWTRRSVNHRKTVTRTFDLPPLLW